MLGEIHKCKSCGNLFDGSYCNQCGEKVIRPSDRSFKKFLNNMMIAVTLADNKFFRCLWLVVSNPGFLSREITEGRTVKYLRPLSLFFVLNLVYFFFPVIQLFSASLKTQLATTYGVYAKHLVAQRAISHHISASALEVLYNQKSNAFAKTLVIVFAVLASLPLNLLYRNRDRYFNDHVGLMIELACFNLFINALGLSLAARILRFGHYLDDDALLVIFIVTNAYFLIRASYTFYRQRGVQLILKAILMMAVLKVALEAYRFVLFNVTIWSI